MSPTTYTAFENTILGKQNKTGQTNLKILDLKLKKNKTKNTTGHHQGSHQTYSCGSVLKLNARQVSGQH